MRVRSFASTGLLLVVVSLFHYSTQAGRVTKADLLAHSSFTKFVSSLRDDISLNSPQEKLGKPLKFLQFKQEQKLRKGRQLNAFQYSNCADPSSEIVVPSNVSLKPDPVQLPGNITAAGSLLIRQGFGSPVQVKLEVKYKILGEWVEVPCIDNVGSCTYQDVCQYLVDPKCPPELVKIGLTCKCPFPQGNFTVNSVTLNIDEDIPVSGDVQVKATASSGGQLLTCAQVQLTIA
ncbi:ganglioside gm2 activator [Plakobranchus ocellatus]|uniref:Ganglioside gm2 activator n=1 Tax=Plakobranchus ocellatus TaxID=259542 RepID=A0AAV3Z8H1_9GAST|nr:ganglioside gm2 activator [Plakobranchus ocellatus]